MATTPVSAPAPTTTPTTASQATAGGAFKADSSTFMTLLVENMKHQDPMQPQDSTAFMQQISQMTMVEQLTALADTSKQAAQDQSTAKTVGLLGRTVTYKDSAGATHSGVVQRVDVSTKSPTMTVDGIAGVDPSTVTEVA